MKVGHGPVDGAGVGTLVLQPRHAAHPAAVRLAEGTEILHVDAAAQSLGTVLHDVDVAAEVRQAAAGQAVDVVRTPAAGHISLKDDGDDEDNRHVYGCSLRSVVALCRLTETRGIHNGIHGNRLGAVCRLT